MAREPKALDEELEVSDTEEIQTEAKEPGSSDDNVIVLNDRKFHIEEPRVDIVLRILNIVGALGVKGERFAAAQLKGEPSARAAIFGMLAGMSMNDLYKFGSAVLQFEDEREGLKWLKENGIKVAPLIKAFFANWRQSEDLQEALANFYQGVVMLMTTLDSLNLNLQIGGEE